MRRRVRGVMMIGAVLTCLVNGAAIAQDKPADAMEMLRERAREDKKLVVATALALTEGEAKAFWPVYNAYQSDMITHYDKLLSLVDRFDKAYDTMTDQTASQLLNEYLALEATGISPTAGASSSASDRASSSSTPAPRGRSRRRRHRKICTRSSSTRRG